MSADDGQGVSWKEVIEGTRAERLRSFCADPTGYVLKEMQTNGNFSSTGALIQNLNEQNAKLRAELTATKQEVENWRQLDAIITKLIEEIPAKVSVEISGSATVVTKAEKPAYRQPAPGDLLRNVAGQQTLDQNRDDCFRLSLASLGLGGSFARQIAETALSAGPVDIEDRRVSNAVGAERERIIRKIDDARKTLLEYGGARPVSFWQKLFAKETYVRAHVAADALHEMRTCIRLEQPFDVLTATRPD